MNTDTSESGLEWLICTALTGHLCDPGSGSGAPAVRERPAIYGVGWIFGAPEPQPDGTVKHRPFHS